MSQDFSPQMHWHSYLRYPEIYTSNIEIFVNNKSVGFRFTDKEIADHKKHIALYVTASNIYHNLRELLSQTQFEKLSRMITLLTEADTKGQNLSLFPKEVVSWYCNEHNYYYSEPNDEKFLSWVQTHFKEL